MFLMYYEGYVLPSRTTKLELGLVKFYVKKEKRSKMRRLLTNPRHFGFFSPGGGIKKHHNPKEKLLLLGTKHFSYAL